jgi:hypothetical protein
MMLCVSPKGKRAQQLFESVPFRELGLYLK